MKKPRLLLADEPTGNLDTASGARVLDLVDRANEAGTAVILITHDAHVAKRANRQLQILDGVVREA